MLSIFNNDCTARLSVGTSTESALYVASAADSSALDVLAELTLLTLAVIEADVLLSLLCLAGD